MASISRETPFFCMTVSSSLAISSKVKPYWKPEQPPPCTNTRSFYSGLPSSAIRSATLAAALSVKMMGSAPAGAAGAASGAVDGTASGAAGVGVSKLMADLYLIRCKCFQWYSSRANLAVTEFCHHAPNYGTCSAQAPLSPLARKHTAKYTKMRQPVFMRATELFCLASRINTAYVFFAVFCLGLMLQSCAA